MKNRRWSLEGRLALVMAVLLAFGVVYAQSDTFQTPQNLSNVNGPAADQQPSVSSDGRELYIASNRGGGKGGFDIYVAQNPAGGSNPLSFQSAINLVTHNNNIFPAFAIANYNDDLVTVLIRDVNDIDGDGDRGEPEPNNPAAFEPSATAQTVIFNVNSSGNETAPSISQDGSVLFFASDRSDADVLGKSPKGGYDIYILVRNALNEPWRGPFNVESLNTASNELDPEITPDNEYLFFTSNRPGGLGQNDLWLSQRQYPADSSGLRPEERYLSWAGISNIQPVNTPINDEAPGVLQPPTGDLVLYFSSDRPGAPKTDYDVWQSTGDPSDPSSFSLPTKVGAPVSSEGTSALSERSPDTRLGSVVMYFDVKDKPGGLADRDIWVTSTASEAVPTLSEWGMIAFVALLAIGLGFMITRRETAMEGSR